MYQIKGILKDNNSTENIEFIMLILPTIFTKSKYTLNYPVPYYDACHLACKTKTNTGLIKQAVTT